MAGDESLHSINPSETDYLKFDVISCLNLLDRCDTPYTLLKQIKQALVPNGLLVVALVLPFRPFVEYNKDNKPVEDLLNLASFSQNATQSNTNLKESVVGQPDSCALNYNDSLSLNTPATTSSSKIESCTRKMNKINSQISYLMENVFKPIGFELVKFSRVPYLCEGNLLQSFYFMNDYIFVLRSTK